MSTQEGGGGIRTSDLRFMRRGPSELISGKERENNIIQILGDSGPGDSSIDVPSTP
jgi:hypothetical protein